MADAYITSGASSLGASGLKSLLTFFSDSFIARKRSRGSILNYVNSDASALVGEKGQSVNVPLSTSVSSQLLTDGNAIVKDDTVGSSATVTLNKHRYIAFGVTQLGRALAGDAAALGLLNQRMDSLLNDVEADVASVITSGFSTNTVGTYTSNVTEANVIAAMGKLYAQNVPAGEPIHGFARHDSTAWGQLSTFDSFTRADARGNMGPVADPGYGTDGIPWHGALWHLSNSLPKNTNNVDNAVFHKDAICVAFRAKPAPLSPGVLVQNIVRDGITIQLLVRWDGAYLADELVASVLYGYSVGDEKFGCLIKS